MDCRLRPGKPAAGGMRARTNLRAYPRGRFDLSQRTCAASRCQSRSCGIGADASTLSANRRRESFQPSLNSRDILLELRNRRPTVEARSGLQVDRQAPTVHPQIFQRRAVLKPCVAIHNQLNRTRHNPAPRPKFAFAMKADWSRTGRRHKSYDGSDTLVLEPRATGWRLPVKALARFLRRVHAAVARVERRAWLCVTHPNRYSTKGSLTGRAQSVSNCSP